MRTREILTGYGKNGYIGKQDLENLRAVAAALNVAGSGNPCLDKQQAYTAFYRSWTFHEEMRSKYEIQAEDAVEFSLFDGAILDSESAEEQ